MPCKAKLFWLEGHTAETAYFTIPLYAQHGMFLTCSHTKCHQFGGKRFRVCAVCDRPVSKHSFSKLHGHGHSLDFDPELDRFLKRSDHVEVYDKYSPLTKALHHIPSDKDVLHGYNKSGMDN